MSGNSLCCDYGINIKHGVEAFNDDNRVIKMCKDKIDKLEAHFDLNNTLIYQFTILQREFHHLNDVVDTLQFSNEMYQEKIVDLKDCIARHKLHAKKKNKTLMSNYCE
jgi:prefoldin subunit 5